MDSDDTELQRWARIIHERGHAGTFARPNNPRDRAIVERQTADEWAQSMAIEFGRQITNVSSNPSDPPDCTAVCDGRPITIELVEMVNGKLLAKLSEARKRGQLDAARAGAFSEAQGNRERFIQAVNERLDDKHANYAASARTFDVLIIHTDEPWLGHRQVGDWLALISFAPRRSARAAYLLLAHDPSFADHWPVFCLYGDV